MSRSRSLPSRLRRRPAGERRRVPSAAPIVRRAVTVVALATAAVGFGGCSRDGGRALARGGAAAPPPTAEFLLAGVDSAYWIRTGADAGPRGVEIRRAPLALARVDGRWQELYVTEEDHSFYDAVFTAQALWRRDLVRDDSVALFGDVTVPRLATAYARRHPDEVLLGPDEPEADDPRVTASTELVLLDVVGSYASVERYTDLHLGRGREQHEMRRSVVDLRSGEPRTLSHLTADAAEAARVGAAGRSAFIAVRDSVRAAASRSDRRAAAALQDFAFDAGSFTLAQVGARAGVTFYAVGTGGAADGFALPVAPIPIRAGAWWDSARTVLPSRRELDSGGDGRAGTAPGALIWQRAGLTAELHPDDAHPHREAADGSEDGLAEPMALTLRDSHGGRWRLTELGAPVSRLYWIDATSLPEPDRRALARAFYEAAFYDETLRAVSARPPVARHRRPGATTSTAGPAPRPGTTSRASASRVSTSHAAALTHPRRSPSPHP